MNTRIEYNDTDFIAQAREEEEYRQRNEFVQHQPLFASWAARPRRLLEMSLRKDCHPYGSVIMRQGQPAHGLVFILRYAPAVKM